MIQDNFLTVIEIFVFSTLFVSAILYFGSRSAQKERSKTHTKIKQVKMDEMLNSGDAKKFGDSYKELDLNLLKDISSNQIKLLKLNDINNIIELRNKIYSDDHIDDYSIKLGVRKKLIEEWINLGEFSRIQGINNDYIDQLKSIGINSISDLSKKNPGIIYNRLKQNEAFENKLPSIGMIKYWIRNAKQIEETHVQIV